MRTTLKVIMMIAVAIHGFANGEQESVVDQGEVVTIEILHWYLNEAGPFAEELRQVIEQQVDGVEVELIETAWTDLQSRVQSRVAAGNLPDIMDFKDNEISIYGGETGILREIPADPYLKHIPEAAYKQQMIDGKNYSVPYTSLYQGTFYNRAIFSRYRIEPPETFDELVEIVELLNSNGVTPFATHYQDWQIQNSHTQYTMSEVFEDDPEWGFNLFRGQAGFLKNQGWRNVFNNVKFVLENSWDDGLSVNFQEAVRRFGQGDAAMFVTGTWSTAPLMDSSDVDFGIFPFPARDGQSDLIIQTDHNWVASKSTEHPDQVMEIFDLLSSDKRLAQIAIDYNRTNSLIADVWPSTPYPVSEDIDRYIAEGRLVNVGLNNKQFPVAYKVEMKKIMTEWLLGSIEIDEALTQADAFRERSPKPAGME